MRGFGRIGQARKRVFIPKRSMNMKEKLKVNPELIESLEKLPARVKVAKNSKENELLVFFKKGRLYIHGIAYENGAEGTPSVHL